MINIDIKKPNRCNGDNALFISFPYDMEILTIIREYPTRFWDINNKTWEIPFNKLADFLAKVSKYDIDIHIEDPSIFADKDIITMPDFNFKTTPFTHQIDGFNYGLNHDKWLLGDEQGCVSGESFVKIKEQGKSATRNIKIKHLKGVFDNDSTVKIKSLVNGRFAYMPIKAVVDKGIQRTIELTLEDTSIQCTPDHLIYTENGWVEADKLNVGDKVFTNGVPTCPMCGATENLITYKYSKFLGYCRSCMYIHRNGTKYNEITKKLDKSGYVRIFGKATRTMPNYDKAHGFGLYEHHQVWYENTGHIVDTSTEVVHHKNGIKTDNRFENLQLMSIAEHDKLHSAIKTNHLYQFNENLDFIERNGTKIYLTPRLQAVKAKTSLGSQQVWDIAIDSNDIHNFICNNIVVHNCGKTKQVIDIAVARKQLYGYTHCLIVCGVNGLKWNWASEVVEHSNETPYILGQRLSKSGKLVIGSTNDKFEDIKNLKDNPNYFIITNIETLRNEDCTKLLSTMCSNGTISMIAADEVHKCFDYNSLVTTNLGDLKIGDIVTNKMNVLVKSYNEQTRTIEYKPITNWFENDITLPMMELTFEVNGVTKTIKCTHSHKFYTHNRGWVEAQYLDEFDDIADIDNLKMAKLISRKFINNNTNVAYDIEVEDNHNYFAEGILVHNCKNPQSQQGRGFLELHTPTMIAMTGTPLLNTPLDLYIILKWLGYESHSFFQFKNHICNMGGYGNHQIIGYKNLKELRDILDDIMLRRLKEDVLDLPEKVFVDEYIEMDAKQTKIYNEVTMDIKANIDKIKMVNNPLAELIRLRQATGYTGILSSEVKVSAKLDRMVELIDDAIANNRKVVIFSNWTDMTDIVEVYLKKNGYNYTVITGKTKDSDRQNNVRRFQEDPKCQIILGTTGAMGTGLTLTAGTVEIFLDEPWTMALKDQAIDRCHRIGQKNNITIYTLLCKDTIDERIHNLIYKKGALSDALVDGKVVGRKGELLNYLIG